MDDELEDAIRDFVSEQWALWEQFCEENNLNADELYELMGGEVD